MSKDKEYREVDLQKTWKKPNPFRIEGLPENVVGKFVDNNNIERYKGEGWQILERDMSIAKNVKVGYDDRETTENKFTYRGFTVMVASKEMIDERNKRQYNKGQLALGKNALDKTIGDVSGELGKGVSAIEPKLIQRQEKIKE